MNIIETFKLALKNIAGSKMRSFLTMLGIIIGVCAVIVIVGLGNGMTNYIQDSFSEIGTNLLQIEIYGRGTSRQATAEDMYAIVENNRDCLDKLSPLVYVPAPVKIGSETHRRTSAMGISEEYFAGRGYGIEQGRGIEYMDVLGRSNVCVVGKYVSETYYGGAAVGDTIKVGNAKLKIVGVMEQDADEMDEGGTDDYVYLPYSTASRVAHVGTFTTYAATVHSEEQAAQGKKAIEDGLFKIYGDTNAYSVISAVELLDLFTSMVDTVIVVLTIIAAISLLVGGIGIMNIMLVSVTERTREIGIRKALGAREGTILQQFVIEAATTAAIGGLIGIGMGYLLSSVATKIIAALMPEAITVTPSADSVLVTFCISAGIGVLFGYLPARKAARLNPIEALRYD